MPIDRPSPLALAPARPDAARNRFEPERTGPRASVLALAEAVGAIESAQLLRGAQRIAIRHGSELYWLRSTRQGKLLLTK